MDNHSAKRPDGQNQKFCAILSAGAAIIMFVFAILLPLERYGEVIARNVAARFWMLMVAGGLVQVALLCSLTAIVVKALWFLPGRDVESLPIENSELQTKAPSSVIPASVTPLAPDSGNAALIFGVLSVFIMLGFVLFLALVAG